jgi:hypothetical protein
VSAAAALLLVNELMEDLEAHAIQEDGPVEMKNRTGSWEDVQDRLQLIKEQLT